MKKQKTKIEAVLFDFGRVLMTAQDAHLYEENDKRFGFLKGHTRKWIDEFYHYGHIGQLETMEEFWSLCTTDTGKMTLSDAEDFWTRIKATQRPNDVLIRFIKEYLVGKMQLVVLSNFTKDLPDYLKRFKIDHLFSRVFISAKLGTKKPDARIYQYALDALRVPAGSCLFIDDKQINIQTAQDLGMIGILFTNTDEVIRNIRALV